MQELNTNKSNDYRIPMLGHYVGENDTPGVTGFKMGNLYVIVGYNEETGKVTALNEWGGRFQLPPAVFEAVRPDTWNFETAARNKDGEQDNEK